MFTEKTNASTYGNNVFPLKTNDLSLFLSRNKSGKNLPRIRLSQRGSIRQQQPKYLFPNSYSLGENKSIISLARNYIVRISFKRSTDATKFHFRLTVSTNILNSKKPACYSYVNAKYKNLKITPCEIISRNSTQEGSLLMHTTYIILYMPRTSLADSHQYFKITSGRLICLSKILPYVKEIV